MRLVLDAQGEVIGRQDYSAYGSVVAQSGLMPSVGYVGMWQHHDSGINLTWYRGYQPAAGRWLSRDPIEEQGGLNLFGYVEGNPLMWTDPLGLATGVTIWKPVGWGASSFGHVSTTINGKVYSYGPGGMSILRQAEYLAKNGFRDGMEVNLNLSLQQEGDLSACLVKPQGEYNALTNNCGSPIQRCLAEVEVNDFLNAFKSTAIINGRHIFPVDLGNGLLSSGSFGGAVRYPASRPASGFSAPWAR